MKPDKKEITLNERDSLFEMLCLEKMLLEGYAETLCFAERKEVRADLINGMQDTARTLIDIQDLGKSSENVLTTI